MQSLSGFFARFLDRPLDRGAVIAAVGGGGKTAVLYLLAKVFAETGKRVCLTTTTHIYDPRTEAEQRPFDSVRVIPEFAQSPWGDYAAGFERRSVRAANGGSITVLASQEAIPDRSAHQGGESSRPLLKLKGIHPEWIGIVGNYFDLVLVESDGSRHLPVKAPAEHEPVIPDLCDAVLGCLGLDCLGLPMDEYHVHRPALFGALSGCGAGEPIEIRHIINLVMHPQGLFKGSPKGALQVALFNKADLLSKDVLQEAEASLRQVRLEQNLGMIICSVKQDRIYSWFSA